MVVRFSVDTCMRVSFARSTAVAPPAPSAGIDGAGDSAVAVGTLAVAILTLLVVLISVGIQCANRAQTKNKFAVTTIHRNNSSASRADKPLL